MRKFLSKVPAWLAGAFLVFATACFLLPYPKEGKHRTQALTLDDINRGKSVAACLQQWARSNGHPAADYSDVDFSKLTIVRVGDPGVLGWYASGNDTTYFFTNERESGDTLFIAEGVSASAFAGYSRHGDVHVVQQSHNELIGSNGDIHWAPPWDACRVPRVFFQ